MTSRHESNLRDIVVVQQWRPSAHGLIAEVVTAIHQPL